MIHADTPVFTVRFHAPLLADGQLDGSGAPLRLSMIRSGDKASDTCGFLEVAGVTLSY